MNVPGPQREKGRGESLRRVLALYRRLEPLRYAPSLHDLALEFRVDVRTVRRDLELLESVGLNVPKWRMNEQLADIRGLRCPHGV